MNKWDDFTKRLAGSHTAVEAVAKWLEQWGKVDVPALRIAPNQDVADLYKDNGDIFFYAQDGRKLRIEVKGRTLKFTSQQDFPYPDMAVCASESWERAVASGNKPYAYITVADDLYHIGIVKVRTTYPYWKERVLNDPVRGHSYAAKFCPLTKVKWETLNQRSKHV